MRFLRRAVSVLLCFALVPALALAQQPEAQPPAEEVSPDPWPKTATVGTTTYGMYQPQTDSWDYYSYKAHAAVSVKTADAKEPVFGVIEITASTSIDRQAQTVHFTNIQVTKAMFPTVPASAAAYQKAFQQALSNGSAAMPLGHLQAELGISGAEKKARAVPVKNEPPAFIFSPTPAILVIVDGQPSWTPVPGNQFSRILNTRALVLYDRAGNYLVHLFDGFLQASALTGPWTVATNPPAGAVQAAQDLGKQNQVDLLAGTPDPTTKKMPSLAGGTPPAVFVVTSPTELVVTQGPADWAPLSGTQLLYVKNTTGNVFRDLVDQQVYVLVTGRWFRASDLTGPWLYVAGKDLPVDFALIPDDSPKENAKASVPGTPQAAEAVIANEIPQTASIEKAKAKFKPQVDGPAQIQPIPDTTLSYVVNSATPIIEVSNTNWYACQNGVWFTTTGLASDWVVASSVPAVIYSIPPSSPLYYVTFVKVYNATPTTVVVGYTPGYLGTVVASDGVVVYGTGYTYTPYISTSVWYPPPVTYGYAAAPTWTPWTGWAVGFGMGFAMAAATPYYWGGCWGAAPYWGAMPYAYAGAAYGAYGGAAAWGPGGWAATSGNMYHQYGATSAVTRSSAGYNAWTGNAWSSHVGTSYNSATGRMSAGQTGSVANAYTGNYGYGNRGATYNPNTGVAAAGGRATVGNAYTGQQATVGHATVAGPGGQTAHVQQVNNNVYAEHDGNVYKGSSGGGFQQYGSGPQLRRPAVSLDVLGRRQGRRLRRLRRPRRRRLEQLWRWRPQLGRRRLGRRRRRWPQLGRRRRRRRLRRLPRAALRKDAAERDGQALPELPPRLGTCEIVRFRLGKG